MTDEDLSQVGGGGFEGLKKVNDYDAEILEREADTATPSGYSQWRSFEKVADLAIRVRTRHPRPTADLHAFYTARGRK